MGDGYSECAEAREGWAVEVAHAHAMMVGKVRADVHTFARGTGGRPREGEVGEGGGEEPRALSIVHEIGKGRRRRCLLSPPSPFTCGTHARQLLAWITSQQSS